MIRSIRIHRRPVLLLGVMALCGLMLRGQAIPAPGLVTTIWGTLCHVAGTDRQDPPHPLSDCESCLFCQAVHGDHGATPILPPCTVPPLQPALQSCGTDLTSGGTGEGQPQGAPRARAPPASA